MPENVWITRLDAPSDEVDGSLALAGQTLAVKDNIDVAGVPTTAGCPTYAYVPESTAPVVQRLVDAGASVVGKTNLDQFATGLTGTRSPYGMCRSVLDPDRISGGSSSGSAVAVAAGLVTIGIGTDTAGSGRVPAACNGIMGWKPTPGLLSTRGIVPACRSIDCPSIFTATVAEARRLARLLAPELAAARCDVGAGVRVGIPGEEALAVMAPAAFDAFCATVMDLGAAGAEIVEIDIEPFLAAGRLLYGGAWPAERYAAVGRFIEEHPADVHPVVASIITAARELTASQAFEDQYRLLELAAAAEGEFAAVDVLLLPTVPDVPTVDAILADPYEGNYALGRYTTFVNLLGLSAVAVPGVGRSDGVPSGVSVVGRGGEDHLALDVASLIQREERSVWIGGGDRLPIVVVGAHLAGQPLNHQLTERGGRLELSTTTAPCYRLHALPTSPPKPGLVRTCSSDGASIEVEVWSLPAAGFGTFVAAVPRPLTIGKVELADGRTVSGFLCEPGAIGGAPDITRYGGWRNYLSVGAVA